MLQSHAKVTKFDAIEPNKLYGLNVWIIHVIGEKRRIKLLDVLKKSQLQFDSHVFEFFESNQGTKQNNFLLTRIDKYFYSEIIIPNSQACDSIDST